MYAYNYNREYTDFIVELVRMTGCETYLELGISNAHNIHAIVPYCKRCVGVDIKDIRDFKDFEFYHMDTLEFFKQFPCNPDIIFIDANHNFDYVKRDFCNSLSILNRHGIILLHDTDPTEKKLLQSQFCSDAYKIVNWIGANYPICNVLTLPVSTAGLTLVNRSTDRRIYDHSKP